jgi:pyruvate formate lyase activating enzyme
MTPLVPEDDRFTIATKHWHRLDDGRIQCDVCPRACKLHEGQRGLCFVRGRIDDQVKLTSYGRSSGFCVDPVEKKPLNHFLPGSAVLSFGTAGCNLACKFCQNWDISKSREVDTLASRATPDDIARTADELGCRSVAFTYNDPTIFWEYAADVADACHDRGIKAVAVTAGYMCAAPRAEFYRHIDAANVDLKAFTEDFCVPEGAASENEQASGQCRVGEAGCGQT